MREIERRYGATPSDDDRDLIIPPYLSARPWYDGSTSTGARIARRPWSIRKADDQAAVGLRCDGKPAYRGRALTDPMAVFESVPERFWPLVPIAVLLFVATVIALGVVMALAVG